jgi:general secretion pathway protein E
MSADSVSRAIDFEFFQAAEDKARFEGTSFIVALQELVNVSRTEAVSMASEFLGYQAVTLEHLISYNPDFDAMPYVECDRRKIAVVVDDSGGQLLVLTEPFNIELEDWAVRQLRRDTYRPKLGLADVEDLNIYLRRQESHLRAINAYAVNDETDGKSSVVADITLTSISNETSNVVKLVNSTLYDALKMHASDIHFECDNDDVLNVRYRIDGVLTPIAKAGGTKDEPDFAAQVISRIKVMSELDIAERRIPQDGRFKILIANREIDFRVSIMPNIFGEDAVLRLLDRQSLVEDSRRVSLDSLGLDKRSIDDIRSLSIKPHGMLLVTGPTGSGKTTTLYGAITEINGGSDKIVTIEDPVEYRIPGVLQIPVNEKKGLTFAKGLRSILRHDPDKILVGEIRDAETAQIAVQAALTGHLVFTTVHANNVFDVLGRFLHMGIDAYSFAAALNGIVAQRLLRVNCPHCSNEVGHFEIDSREGVDIDAMPPQMKSGKGCPECRGSGYKGRKAVVEVLTLDDTLREMIATKASIGILKAQAERLGMRQIRDVALDCVRRGETTLSELTRVLG